MNRSSWFDRFLSFSVVVAISFTIWKLFVDAPKEVPKTPIATLSSPKPLPESQEFSKNDIVYYQKLKLLHTTGNFDGALKYAEDLLAGKEIETQFRDWLSQQIGSLMAASAWLKIKTGDCDLALKILYRAVKLAPTPEAKKGLGFCLHEAKNWPESASWLGAYVLENPEDIDTRALYADSLESLGRYDEAVTNLEGAANSPNNSLEIKDILNQKLQAMKIKAREGVRQKSEYSRRFFVSFREEDHEGLLAGAFEVLESSLDEFMEVLGVSPNDAPIEVVLYRQEVFHEVIPGGPEWSEGIFDGRIRIPVSSAARSDPKGLLATILRHELVHAILHQRANGRPLPPWFDEGLAQYLSCRNRLCAGFHFAPTPGNFSEKKFLSEPFVTLSNIDAGRAYLHSLYLIRMAISENKDETLRNVGADVPVQGKLDSELFSRVLGYRDFDTLWAQANEMYRRHQSF